MDSNRTRSQELYQWIKSYLTPFISKAIMYECYCTKEYDNLYSEVLNLYRCSIIDKDNTYVEALIKKIDSESINSRIPEKWGE